MPRMSCPARAQRLTVVTVCIILSGRDQNPLARSIISLAGCNPGAWHVAPMSWLAVKGWRRAAGNTLTSCKLSSSSQRRITRSGTPHGPLCTTFLALKEGVGTRGGRPRRPSARQSETRRRYCSLRLASWTGKHACTSRPMIVSLTYYSAHAYLTERSPTESDIRSANIGDR
jgi:hypothetical protein